jgi:hypothetical protein
MISGVPGVSGLGSFVLSRGYTIPVLPSPKNIPEAIFTRLEQYSCVISPITPIALIVKIKQSKTGFDTFPKTSENDIPYS